MPDLYRAVTCSGCGKTHDLYDTSVVRHAPKGTYSYTCPATRLEGVFQPLSPPEVVAVLPDDAIPMVWVSGWSSPA
jgi:hypothetical protein